MKELGQPNTEFHVSWILSSCSQAPHSFSFASTAKQIVDNIEYCISLLYDLSIFITKNLLTEPSPSSLNTNRRYQVHLALLKFEECECAQLWWKILACPQTQRPRIFGANLLREKIRRLINLFVRELVAILIVRWQLFLCIGKHFQEGWPKCFIR